MTTRLRLIAHASTEATRRSRFAVDEPLDGRGAGDAAPTMAAVLGQRDSRGVLRCGPERRCRETAGAEARVDAGLRDWDLGAWAGRSWDEVALEDAASARAWTTDADFAGHGGESLTVLLARVAHWLSELAPLGDVTDPSQPSGPVVAVTSPAVVRAALVTVLSAPPAAFWRIDVAPLSGVSLSAYAHRWNLRA